MTSARPAPTSTTSAPKKTKAAAVQNSPRTTIEAMASPGTPPSGRPVAASGVSRMPAIVRAPAMIARGSRSPSLRFSIIGPAA